MGLFLGKNVPLISKELLNPWRVASLGVGLVLLVLGSVYLPSDDWDVPLCFVMGLPAYVLAPWVVRQAVGLRWKWLLLATFAFWLTVDGTYTLYWWLKGFPHLAEFRPANFFYCTPIFWIAGCFWNVDFKSMEWRLPKAAEMESFQLGVLQIRIVLVVLVIAGMIVVVGSAVRFQPLGNKGLSGDTASISSSDKDNRARMSAAIVAGVKRQKVKEFSGKVLLRELARIAVERGCGRLEWWCLDWNKPSIDFYLSLGAEPMKDWTVYRIAGETLNEAGEMI